MGELINQLLENYFLPNKVKQIKISSTPFAEEDDDH